MDAEPEVPAAPGDAAGGPATPARAPAGATPRPAGTARSSAGAAPRPPGTARNPGGPAPRPPGAARRPPGTARNPADAARRRPPTGVAADTVQAGDEPGAEAPNAESDAQSGATRQAKAPWHFKMIVVGTVGYLGWRLYQGISWLAHHIH